MNLPIVDTFEPVTLIGGGDSSHEDVEIARNLAPICVAADSGAHLALDMGVDLTAVIGDMDSISDRAREQIPPERFHFIAEQDSTDFDKALRSINAPLIIAIGFTGGQIDHSLAALNTLVKRRNKAIILMGAEDVVFLCPKVMELPMPAGTRISLFPMGSVQGHSKGLQWPIDGIDFAPGQRSGTSNRATGGLYLEMNAPAMLCILPREFIHQVAVWLQALPAHARWPALAE